MTENQKIVAKVGIWIGSITTAVAMSVFFTLAGVKMEKDACLVRAYENRIDVDLGKKVCAFNQNLTSSVTAEK